MRIIPLFIVLIFPFILFGLNDKNIHSNTSLIKNYTAKTYNANPQIFSILQNKKGVMYFANQLGVVGYDGRNWNLIKTDNHHVYNLAQDNKGVIYVLCDGDFGILAPNSVGELIFKSKLDLFKGLIEDYSFLEFEDITFAKNIAYINTSEGLFKLNEDKISKINTANNVIFIKNINDTIYLQIKDQGLHTLENDTIKALSQGLHFTKTLIVDLIQFNSETYVITIDKGIFRINNEKIQIRNTLVDSKITSSVNNRDINLVLGTTNGILILDKNLTTYKRIGSEEGIADATIKKVYLDHENNLWLGTQNGISKVEIDTPIEIFNKQNELNGSIEAIEGFNNTIFCATGNGVYYLNEQGNAVKVKSIETDCYGLKAINFGTDSILLVAEVNGVYQIDQKLRVKKIADGGPYMFKQSPLNKNEIFTIHFDGISNFIYKNGKFIEENYIKNFSKGETHNFLIQKDGTIWIGTLDDGIYKTTLSTYTDSSQYKHYSTEHGLPPGQCYLFEHEEKIYAGTDLGLFVFDNKEFKLSEDFSLGSNKNIQGIHRISKDKKGNIWAVLFDEENNYEIGFSALIDGQYEWSRYDFIKHSDAIVHGFYHSTNKNTWFGGPNGLIKYNQNYLKKNKQKFNCILRKIALEDSLLFGGSSILNNNTLNINFSGNTPITIEYAATSFIDEDKTVYSFYLEGYNDKWSDWSSRTLKEFNLHEGSYTFHVKAKNILGVESNVTSYTIIVAPPWYRTILAIICYVVLFILVIYGLIKLSIKRVAQLNKKLEDTVLERTKEIVEQKEMVEEKNKEIMDSMTYAKRIQTAILPPSKMVNEYLQQSFILYKPKDIVAGDFYWLSKVGDKVLFAAADCTGHGVPGAMVSVVCNNGLNRSVREFGLTDPGEILTKTREIVLEEFGKADEDVKDGMDIALCALSDNKLQYAGANNPLWIIRNKEIIETRANKQPIGKFENPLPYTTHNFELQKGDCLYIFSDGYVDQFGGPKGKKYKAKAFRELLLSIQDKPMPAQKIIIDNTFEDWKGELEQIDDVCVIGLKI